MWCGDVCVCYWCLLFFFFKQKTAYELRISDWSSDVCSSDLEQCFVAEAEIAETKHFREFRERFVRHRSGRSTAFGSRGSSTRSPASIRQSSHQPLVGRSGISSVQQAGSPNSAHRSCQLERIFSSYVLGAFPGWMKVSR